MNPKGAAEKGKRKMNAEAPSGHQMTNLFNVHGQSQHFPPPPNTHFHFSSPRLPADGHFSHVQQLLNAAANKPFSFMSLLTAPDEEEEPLFRNTNTQRAHIDYIISVHSENLKQALGGALGQHLQDVHRDTEERAAKRLKDRESDLLTQNARLQSMADHYKAQAERLMIRVRTLERTTTSLSERLDQANAARFYAQEAEDEAESSFPDPDRVAPIMLECRVCERKTATVMMWPCRHICVCKRCDPAATYCPVCCVVKTNSIEVYLPPN